MLYWYLSPLHLNQQPISHSKTRGKETKNPSFPAPPPWTRVVNDPKGLHDDRRSVVAMGMTTEEVVRQAFKNADVDESGTLDAWAVVVVVVVVKIHAHFPHGRGTHFTVHTYFYTLAQGVKGCTRVESKLHVLTSGLSAVSDC